MLDIEVLDDEVLDAEVLVEDRLDSEVFLDERFDGKVLKALIIAKRQGMLETRSVRLRRRRPPVSPTTPPAPLTMQQPKPSDDWTLKSPSRTTHHQADMHALICAIPPPLVTIITFACRSRICTLDFRRH